MPGTMTRTAPTLTIWLMCDASDRSVARKSLVSRDSQSGRATLPANLRCTATSPSPSPELRLRTKSAIQKIRPSRSSAPATQTIGTGTYGSLLRVIRTKTPAIMNATVPRTAQVRRLTLTFSRNDTEPQSRLSPSAMAERLRRILFMPSP